MVPARPAFCALGRRTGKEAMTLPFAFRVLLAATLLVAAAEAGAACSSASDCQVAQPHCCAGRCVCDRGCSVEDTADCTERGLCDDTNDIPRVCSGGDQGTGSADFAGKCPHTRGRLRSSSTHVVRS